MPLIVNFCKTINNLRITVTPPQTKTHQGGVTLAGIFVPETPVLLKGFCQSLPE